jgi:predicted butyrate kinase (DUF1464 family)
VLRVVGTDPGTSSLDLLLLVDGKVSDQARVLPGQLRDDPDAIRRVLEPWSPLDLIVGPSGYGVPLIAGNELTEEHLDLMALVRPDERGGDLGVLGFRSFVRAIVATGHPSVFLPGLIHLPSVPGHRKVNTIDLGTPDKLCVAALALRFDGDERGGSFEHASFAVVEIGSAFSALLVMERGALVDASAGTRGPIGLRSGGAWDGEVACWRSPLSKADLFRGGLSDIPESLREAFRESLIKHIAALRAITPFERLYLSGAGLDRPEIRAIALSALAQFGETRLLPALAGATVKHAAQGAALLADGLAGGSNADLVDSLRLREARGTVLNWLPPASG